MISAFKIEMKVLKHAYMKDRFSRPNTLNLTSLARSILTELFSNFQLPTTSFTITSGPLCHFVVCVRARACVCPFACLPFVYESSCLKNTIQARFCLIKAIWSDSIAAQNVLK